MSEAGNEVKKVKELSELSEMRETNELNEQKKERNEWIQVIPRFTYKDPVFSFRLLG